MSQSMTFENGDIVHWWSTIYMTGTVIDKRKRLFCKPELLIRWDDCPEKPTWHIVDLVRIKK